MTDQIFVSKLENYLFYALNRLLKMFPNIENE